MLSSKRGGLSSTESLRTWRWYLTRVTGPEAFSLLRLITDDYVGIDYTPAMIAAARRRHPGIDIRESDARRLDGFAADHFGFVFFSFSGIDAVNHEDRPRVLSELFRVLRPDGWLLFSTHNMVGPSYREVPWRGYAFPGSRWYRTFRWAARLPMNLPRYLRRWRNWLRNRGLSSASKDWAMRIAAPHDFGIVIHYVTLAGLFGELTAAGFADIEVISSEDGRAIADCDLGQVNAFYVLARKAAVRR